MSDTILPGYRAGMLAAAEMADAATLATITPAGIAEIPLVAAIADAALRDTKAGISASIRAAAGSLPEPQAEQYIAGLMRGADICQHQEKEFLSEKYASEQPLGSFTERFACNECAKAIRAEAERAAFSAASLAPAASAAETSSDAVDRAAAVILAYTADNDVRDISRQDRLKWAQSIMCLPHKGDCPLALPEHQAPFTCDQCCAEDARMIARAALEAAAVAPSTPLASILEPQAAVIGETFQQRVQPWLMACFGAEISGDREERNHRFLEEALELVQACECSRSEAHQLVDYVFDRPIGDPHQEVGGVMVTLSALCLANNLDMHEAAENELARIWTKVEKIRAKQAAKPKHSPLPEHARLKTVLDRETATIARHDAKVAALEARVRELEDAPSDGWLPIENALFAVQFNNVLIAGKYPNGISYVEESFRHADGHWNTRKLDPPTHWQPLPAPPARAALKGGSDGSR